MNKKVISVLSLCCGMVFSETDIKTLFSEINTLKKSEEQLSTIAHEESLNALSKDIDLLKVEEDLLVKMSSFASILSQGTDPLLAKLSDQDKQDLMSKALEFFSATKKGAIAAKEYRKNMTGLIALNNKLKTIRDQKVLEKQKNNLSSAEKTDKSKLPTAKASYNKVLKSIQIIEKNRDKLASETDDKKLKFNDLKTEIETRYNQILNMIKGTEKIAPTEVAVSNVGDAEFSSNPFAKAEESIKNAQTSILENSAVNSTSSSNPDSTINSTSSKPLKTLDDANKFLNLLASKISGTDAQSANKRCLNSITFILSADAKARALMINEMDKKPEFMGVVKKMKNSQMVNNKSKLKALLAKKTGSTDFAYTIENAKDVQEKICVPVA